MSIPILSSHANLLVRAPANRRLSHVPAESKTETRQTGRLKRAREEYPLDPVVKAARIIINDLESEVITKGVLEDTWPLERFGVLAGITMDEDTIDKVLACIRKDEPSVRLMASEDCLEVTADPEKL